MPRHSIAALRDMAAGGETKTDWARLDALTDAEIEAAADPDWQALPADWCDAVPELRVAQKRLTSLRLDADVLDWFKAQGSGYQTRMNAVLRTFMQRRTAPR